MARHNVLGATGEDIAAEYLEGNGYSVIERNYRRPYGEIDIVARLPGPGPFGRGETSGLLVFVEVKSVSYETRYRPEENMHPEKLRRLGNIIMSYRASKRHEGEWRLDLITVYVDMGGKAAKVAHMKNIVIGT